LECQRRNLLQLKLGCQENQWHIEAAELENRREDNRLMREEHDTVLLAEAANVVEEIKVDSRAHPGHLGATQLPEQRTGP
jgi:hypothetical protein